MSLRGLQNQTVTIYTKASYNEYGREVMGGNVNYPARVQETTKRKMMPNGNLVTIDAIAYLPPTATVNTDDRADYNGTKFKIFGKYSAVDGNGNVNNIKLELIKWKET
jgi:hypothetical protein